MDKYGNFSDLQAAERKGVDYRVILHPRPASRIAVIAPHGGRIEPGTSLIAKLVADLDLNLYIFEGLKPTRNSSLHITQPGAVQAVVERAEEKA